MGQFTTVRGGVEICRKMATKIQSTWLDEKKTTQKKVDVIPERGKSMSRLKNKCLFREGRQLWAEGDELRGWRD